MTDALTYNQRFKLGAIRVRRDFADEARKLAVQAALSNDHRACEMHHAEADRHEAAIIEATREMHTSHVGLTRPRIRLAPVTAAAEDADSRNAAHNAAWRAARDPSYSAIARPIEDWNRFVAKLG